MNEDVNFETDFMTWFNYSQSINSLKLIHELKHVLKSKESQKSYVISNGITEDGVTYFITEKYNPTALRLTNSGCNTFYDFLCQQYPEENTEEPIKVESKSEIVSVDKKINPETKNPQENRSKLLMILHKISSKNVILHSLSFSILAFIISQINILPGNISSYKLGNWSIYLFFGMFAFVYFLCIWAYSNLYKNIKLYNEIFKFSILYSSSFFLLAFIETMIIDFLFSESFTIFGSIMLIILGQIMGVILSPILTLIIFFVKGGKIINTNDN
ncbi:MAG: hypothetical protein AB7S48_16905 [Bacteroidales bacterium]